MTKQEQKQQREYILELIRSGMAPKDIVDQVGCGLSSVYVIANRNGITINQYNRVMKKNLPDSLINDMKLDAESGMTSDEISNKYNIPSSSVKEICRGHFTNINQYGLIGTAKSGNRISERIAECLPNWEYAGNYTGTDGKCDIRCKTCGTVKTVCSQAIRKQFARCSACFERERIEREEQKQKEREEREAAKKQLQAETAEERRQRIRQREREREKEKRRRERLEHITFTSCMGCGAMFLYDDRTHQKYCSKQCARRLRQKKKEVVRRIRTKAQMVDNDITLEKLYQRDGGICYLCGRVCDWNDRVTIDGTVICGDNYPSIEHVIPLSKNGKHSWANVKLACRKCNNHKRDNIIESVERLA